MTEFDRNEEMADLICRDLSWQGRKFNLGEFVALLDAEVVAVAASPDEAILSLRSIDPEPSRGMVFEVARPSLTVIR